MYQTAVHKSRRKVFLISCLFVNAQVWVGGEKAVAFERATLKGSDAADTCSSSTTATLTLWIIAVEEHSREQLNSLRKLWQNSCLNGRMSCNAADHRFH